MNQRSLLLVEDNPDDEELIKIALEENRIGNPVVVVRDGAEALDYLFAAGRYTGNTMPEMPVVVLLDLKLPKVGGLEVLRRMRADDRYQASSCGRAHLLERRGGPASVVRPGRQLLRA